MHVRFEHIVSLLPCSAIAGAYVWIESLCDKHHGDAYECFRCLGHELTQQGPEGCVNGAEVVEQELKQEEAEPEAERAVEGENNRTSYAYGADFAFPCSLVSLFKSGNRR